MNLNKKSAISTSLSASVLASNGANLRPGFKILMIYGVEHILLIVIAIFSYCKKQKLILLNNCVDSCLKVEGQGLSGL